jgi:hypothetical protein
VEWRILGCKEFLVLVTEGEASGRRELKFVVCQPALVEVVR